MDERPALYDMTFPQLADLLVSWGEPRFRAAQVWTWLYQSLVGSYAAMTNLPTQLRERLEQETRLELLTPVAEEVSADRYTRKVLFALRDGATIESVLMGYSQRHTACISTQVGCSMGCVFCATGQAGFARNLTAGEIICQVLYFARQARKTEVSGQGPCSRDSPSLSHPITHVVLMGMGEPLANYAATRQALETLMDARGYGFGARRITLSTVGLVPGIRRLAQWGVPINLAVSLHAANDDLRNRLVPINRRYPLAELMAAIREYIHATGRRVTFEYALIAGLNDSAEHASQLAWLLRDLLCHVNLIPLNPTPGSSMQPSPREQVDRFRGRLRASAIPTTVRLRRGIEIEAGCGQLRQRHAGPTGDRVLAFSPESG